MHLSQLFDVDWLHVHVTGALAIGGATLVFLYLFCICNALQGAVIFIFTVLLDPKCELSF